MRAMSGKWIVCQLGDLLAEESCDWSFLGNQALGNKNKVEVFYSAENVYQKLTGETSQ